MLSSRVIESSNYSLSGVRDLRRHAQLRKPWDIAFQSAALIDYEDKLRDRVAQFMSHLQKLCEDEVCIDMANMVSFLAFVFRLSCYYHSTHYIVTVLILCVISCNSLFLKFIIIVINSFTLDSAVNIPSFVMGITTVFCLAYKEDFCKVSSFWVQIYSNSDLAYRASSSTSPG